MKTIETSDEKPPRVLVVDAVRGLAVLCMIQWHCADAWLSSGIREGDVFGRLRIVGGLAAPLFVLLAGISTGLTFRMSAFASSLRRAGTIVLMGYALKWFAWVVDHGAILERVNWAAITLDLLAIGCGWFGLAEERSPRERWGALSLATGAALGLWWALAGTTCAPEVVLRLDVLQGIGAALIVTTSLLAVAHRTRHPALLVAIAGLSFSLATPSLIGVDLSVVPARLLDYVARTTSDPAASGARFPLFPWAGYALVGAAMGTAARRSVMANAWEVPFVKRPQVLVVGALALAWLAYEPSWTAQWILSRGEQPRNLLRLVFNTSIASAMAAASSLCLPSAPRVGEVVRSLGRHSLIVYCVHLELAYGLVAIPIHQALGFAQWAAGATLVIGLMVALARGLDARAEWRKTRALAPREAG